jgi:hypothetical protein
MVNTEWEYRTSPVVHAPNLLGIGTGNLIWNNYGPALYYFPIEYRSRDAKVLSLFIGNRTPFYEFGGPEAETGLSEYTRMLERHHREIDVLVTWTSTPELDAVNRQWFDTQPLHESARVMVLKHR